MQNKFAVISLGCRVNRTEVDDYSAYLIDNGWIMSSIEEAKLILINTCTVTHIADKKTKKTVRHVIANNKNARIIITGCAAVIDRSYFENLDERIEVISKADLPKGDAQTLSSNDFRTRASIKIQDGCDNACTYCIVHIARGKSYSFNKEVIVSRFNELKNSGVREVVLTGVNLGAYKDLVGLLRELVNDKTRIRLSSIEPQNVSDELIDLIAISDGKICRHFHLPLQSGSSKVLKEMNRNYDTQTYLDLVKKLRAKIPNMALSTDVIVGFPGESDKDFRDTIEVCRQCGFMQIHVFPYSMREGTPAADRLDQVPDNIKKERATELRKLSDELADIDLNSRKGSLENVLIEKKGVGRTESYHLISVLEDYSVGDLKEIYV